MYDNSATPQSANNSFCQQLLSPPAYRPAAATPSALPPTPPAPAPSPPCRVAPAPARTGSECSRGSNDGSSSGGCGCGGGGRQRAAAGAACLVQVVVESVDLRIQRLYLPHGTALSRSPHQWMSAWKGTSGVARGLKRTHRHVRNCTSDSSSSTFASITAPPPLPAACCSRQGSRHSAELHTAQRGGRAAGNGNGNDDDDDDDNNGSRLGGGLRRPTVAAPAVCSHCRPARLSGPQPASASSLSAR